MTARPEPQRLALVTCADLPGWEVDDAPLHRALAERGVEISQPSWSDPSVDWAAFHGALIRTTWDYCDDRDAFVAWAQRVGALTQLMNPPEVVAWNTHKSYLRELERLGLPILPTVWMQRGESYALDELMAARAWDLGFIKPQVGANAQGTLRFAADPEGFAQAREHMNALIPTEDLMLQPYLTSVETFGEVSAIFFGGSFSHGVRKIPLAGDYRVQDDHGASDEPFVFEAQFIERLQALARSLEYDLTYARFDFLRADDGGYLLTELELVEPSLFFRHDAGAAGRLADVLVARLGSAP